MRGAFVGAGGEESGGLCSKDGGGGSLVYWGTAPGPCPSEFAPEENTLWNQGMGEGRVGFSRLLVGVDPERILSRRRWWPDDLPPGLTIEHDGIEEAFAGKGGIVRYCWDGQWISLPGSD